MSELLQHWQSGLAAQQPAADNEIRRAAMDLAVDADLPHGRVESWKYTSVRALARRQLDVLPAIDLRTIDRSAIANYPAPRIVFVNGHFDEVASDIDGVEYLQIEFEPQTQSFPEVGPANALNQANAALSQGGIRIRARGPINKALQLIWLADTQTREGSQHNTHQVQLDAGATLQLVEHVIANGAHQHLATNRLQIEIHEGAELRHFRAQLDDNDATWVARTEVRLSKAASYRRLDLELGSGLSRHELKIQLLGEGAHVESNGILFGDRRRHIDTRLNVEHRALRTSCALTWRGLATERSRIAFHGGITIAEGADFTEAALSNKTLLLSETAEIDTQPVLEIYADEVQAAHGATVGQLDPASVFYLRSRGIDERNARTLLIAAFVHELLAIIDDEPLRNAFGAHLDAALERVEFE